MTPTRLSYQPKQWSSSFSYLKNPFRRFFCVRLVHFFGEADGRSERFRKWQSVFLSRAVPHSLHYSTGLRAGLIARYLSRAGLPFLVNIDVLQLERASLLNLLVCAVQTSFPQCLTTQASLKSKRQANTLDQQCSQYYHVFRPVAFRLCHALVHARRSTAVAAGRTSSRSFIKPKAR